MAARKSIKIGDYLERLSAIMSLLEDGQREQLIQHMSIQTYKKNEQVYAEGTTPHYLYCLVTGKVKIYKEGVGGRTQIVRVIKPVEYFGYRAAFAGEDYVTSASAFEPSVMVKIPIAFITQQIRINARLGWFFIEQLSRDLGKADERTVNLTQKHIRGRLAEALLVLKHNYGVEEDGSTLSIYLSREDLANLSNMTTSNAIRTLSNFATDKIIAIDGRKIKIIDEQRLERISKVG